MNTVVETPLPDSITYTWTESHRLAARADHLDDNVLPGLVAEYERIHQAINAAKAERDKARKNATSGVEMVQLWCAAHSQELPPTPPAPVESTAQTAPNALGQSPMDDLTRRDVRSGDADAHRALAGLSSIDPADPLGVDQPGPAATVVDSPGGDQVAAAAPFHSGAPAGDGDA